MNCEVVCERLSAYYDGELDESLAAQMRAHLATCESCRAECRCFESLSTLARAASRGGDAPPAWSTVLNRLESGPQLSSRPENAEVDRRVNRGWTTAAIALAAGLLVAIGIWFADDPSHHGGPHPLVASTVAIDLGAVIERFESGADAAIDLLSRQSGAREVAEDGIGTNVALASLTGIRPVSTRVLKFPQCTCSPGECACDGGGCGCVASVYQRDDRSTFLVVEHCRSQPVSFGRLPRQEVEKGGQSVQQLRSDNLLAVSWETDRHRYTAIGLKGDQEANQVVAAAAEKL